MAFVGKSERRRIAANWVWSKCVLPARGKKAHEKITVRLHPPRKYPPTILKRKCATPRGGVEQRACPLIGEVFPAACKLKNERRSFPTGKVPEANRVSPRFSFLNHEELRARTFSLCVLRGFPSLTSGGKNCRWRLSERRLFRFWQLWPATFPSTCELLSTLNKGEL